MTAPAASTERLLSTRLLRQATSSGARSAVAAAMNDHRPEDPCSVSKQLQRQYTVKRAVAITPISEISDSSHSLVSPQPFHATHADDGCPSEAKAARRRNYDGQVKLLMLGDSAVGKSSLLLRFCCNTFDTQHVLTIGVDFKTRIVQLGAEKIKLQIWDTAGQERFRNLTPVYFRAAAGVVLVFDVSSRQSFNNVKHWLRDLEEMAHKNVFKVLVGNKSDLAETREVTQAEICRMTDQYSLKYVETSAKNNINVDVPFLQLAADIRSYQKDPLNCSPPASSVCGKNPFQLRSHDGTSENADMGRCCSMWGYRF